MSNTMFSTAYLVSNKLGYMKEDYKRLIQAAKELQSINTPSEIATFIGEYYQMMTNWKSRGIPKGKVIDIANKIGCNHFWLRDGTGSMTVENSHFNKKASTHKTEQIEPTYVNYQSLLEDLAALPDEDVEIFKQEIRLAAMKARKKQQEKSDRELAAKALDPPSEEKRTA